MINDRLLYNYKMLYMAIVETAIKDYIAALKINNKDKIRELEAFFYSPYFSDLTDDKIHPDYIIRQAKAHVNDDKIIARKRIKKQEVKLWQNF